MAGAEKLTERILSDARLKAEQHLKRAREEAESIMKSSAEEAEKNRMRMLDNAKIEADEARKKMLAAAALDARKQKLKVKQEVIDLVFEKALERLCSLPEDEYFNILAEMIASIIQNGTAEIVLSSADKQKYANTFEEKINKLIKDKGSKAVVSLSSETRDIKGGFILKMGNIEVNSSFDALIKMKRDELEPEIVKVLYK